MIHEDTMRVFANNDFSKRNYNILQDYTCPAGLHQLNDKKAKNTHT